MNEAEHLAEAQRGLRCAMNTGAGKPIRLSEEIIVVTVYTYFF